MRACFLYCNLLELVFVIVISVLFIISQEFTPNSHAIENGTYVRQKHKVTPEKIFCWNHLRPETKYGSMSAIEELSLKKDHKPSPHLTEFARCVGNRTSLDGGKRCFCVNQLWLVVLNFSVASLIAIVTFIDSIFICLTLLSKGHHSQFRVLGSFIYCCTMAIAGLSISVLDAVILSIYWPFTYSKEDVIRYYYDPPITWIVGAALWGVFAILSSVEAIAYLVQFVASQQKSKKKKSSKLKQHTKRSSDGSSGSGSRKNASPGFSAKSISKSNETSPNQSLNPGELSEDKPVSLFPQDTNSLPLSDRF